MTSVVDMRYTLLAPPAILYDSGNESCASEDLLPAVKLENDPYLGMDIGLSDNDIKRLEDELCKYGVTDLMTESEKLIGDMPMFPELSFDVEDMSCDQELLSMDIDSVVDSISTFDCCCSEQARSYDSSSDWSYQSSPRSFGNWSDDDKLSPLNSFEMPSPYLEQRKSMEYLSPRTERNKNYNLVNNNNNNSFHSGKFINNSFSSSNSSYGNGRSYSNNSSNGFGSNSNFNNNNNGYGSDNKYSNNNNNFIRRNDFANSNNKNNYSGNSYSSSSNTLNNNSNNYSNLEFNNVMSNSLWSPSIKIKKEDLSETESITPSPLQTEDEGDTSDCSCNYMSRLQDVAQEKSKHHEEKTKKRRRLNSLSSDSDQSEDLVKESPSKKKPGKTSGRQDNEGKNGSFKPRQLYQFLMDLLRDEDYCPEYIEWVSRDEKVFRLVDSAAVARMWGECKNRVNMTYEKMSRALRYYYENGILERVPNCRLHYRFGKTAYDEYASTW